MNRPRWMNGPLFDLKPGAFWAWWTYAFLVLVCTFLVIATGDLYLMAAMFPGVGIAVMMHLTSDRRYRKGADHV